MTKTGRLCGQIPTANITKKLGTYFINLVLGVIKRLAGKHAEVILDGTKQRSRWPSTVSELSIVFLFALRVIPVIAALITII